jgi:MFS family permease
MTDPAGADSARKPRIFYGYWILLASFLSLSISTGCGAFTFSLFVNPLQEELGWNRGETMAAFTLSFLVLGIASPFIGRLVDRYEPRIVISAGALIAGAGFYLLSEVESLHQFYLAYTIIGAGVAASAQIPTTSVVSNWFNKRRGLAIGILSMGVGAGGFALVPLIGIYLIPNFGWRTAYFFQAIIFWTLIPLALLVIKTRPSYTSTSSNDVFQAATEREEFSTAPVKLSIRKTLASLSFRLISIYIVISSFSSLGIIQNQVPYLEDMGFMTSIAVTTLSICSLVSALAKLAFGWLCDHIPVKHACIIGLAFQVASIMLLLSINITTPLLVIWLYAVIFGLGQGSWLPTMSMLTSTHFGMASYGSIFGMLDFFQNTGAALGPLFAGYLYTLTNGYHQSFIIFLALYIIAIPSILILKHKS